MWFLSAYENPCWLPLSLFTRICYTFQSPYFPPDPALPTISSAINRLYHFLSYTSLCFTFSHYVLFSISYYLPIFTILSHCVISVFSLCSFLSVLESSRWHWIFFFFLFIVNTSKLIMEHYFWQFLYDFFLYTYNSDELRELRVSVKTSIFLRWNSSRVNIIFSALSHLLIDFREAETFYGISHIFFITEILYSEKRKTKMIKVFVNTQE